jgi:hypothetical protein
MIRGVLGLGSNRECGEHDQRCRSGGGYECSHVLSFVSISVAPSLTMKTFAGMIKEICDKFQMREPKNKNTRDVVRPLAVRALRLILDWRNGQLRN